MIHTEVVWFFLQVGWTFFRTRIDVEIKNTPIWGSAKWHGKRILFLEDVSLVCGFLFKKIPSDELPSLKLIVCTWKVTFPKRKGSSSNYTFSGAMWVLDVCLEKIPSHELHQKVLLQVYESQSWSLVTFATAAAGRCHFFSTDSAISLLQVRRITGTMIHNLRVGTLHVENCKKSSFVKSSRSFVSFLFDLFIRKACIFWQSCHTAHL